MNIMFIERAEYKTWIIDESIYCVEEVKSLDSYWTHIDRVSAAVPERSKANKYYLISKSHTPYLVVELYHEYEPWEWCHGYTLWYNYLVIARLDDFYYINILTFDVHRFPENKKFGYCGEFLTVADRLLATSNEKMYCFDNNMHPVWQTEELACDGVLVHYLENNCLRVSGNNDPPYEWGWDEYVIDFTTGKTIEGKNRWS